MQGISACYFGAKLNGFTREVLLDLVITRDLKINGGGDLNEYIIREVSEVFQIIRKTPAGETIIFSLDASGNMTILGSLTSGGLSLSGNLDLNNNDIIDVKNLGIGTSTPTDTVNVHLPTTFLNNYIRFTNTNTGQTTSDGFTIGIDGSNQAVLFNEENTSMIFGTNNGIKMVIQGGGNITMGSITSAQKLNIGGNLYLDAGGDFRIFTDVVLTSTTLGSSVVNSSLTNVGTLTGLTVSAEIGTDGIDVTTGNDYQINNVSVLNATTLGSSVVASSLTSVGTLTNLNVTGNVGIGTDNPSVLLHMYATSPRLFIEATGTNADTKMKLIATGSGKCIVSGSHTGVGNAFMSWGMNSTTSWAIGNEDGTLDSGLIMVVERTGNVGIGDTTPSYKLDVGGDINSTGEYRISTTSVLSATTLGSSVVNSSLTNVGTLTALTVSAEIGTDGIDVTTGNDYQINNVSVLNATTLGSSVVASSLTSVGTLTNLNITGDLVVETDTLFVDVSTDRVGINTNAPEKALQVVGEILCWGKRDSGIDNGHWTDTHFDQAINFQSFNGANYRNYFSGLLGDSSTSGNRYAIAVDGGGGADPNIIMTLDNAGNMSVLNGIGIGIETPATSAALDITSTTKALLLSRMTTTQRDALTALNGMMVYNLTTNAFNFYENGSWVTK